MRRRGNVLKAALAALAVAAFGGLALARQAAQEGRALSSGQERGRLIYSRGEDGSGQEVTALLGDLELPAPSFTCASCHGANGEGKSEGGLRPPPLDWATLSSARASALTGRTRAPYDEASLARAIVSGRGTDGAPLHPGMPRYQMSAEQQAALVAFLKQLRASDAVEPGLEDEAVRVGAALPLTGPLAREGEDVRATLAAYFSEVNAQGGVYGRRLELVVEDSRGEAAGTLAATRRLVEARRVFALVGGFEPRDSEATGEFLRRSGVPLVGPVTLSPRPPVPPNRFVFYLLPTFGDQARSLVDFVASKPEGAAARLGVVYENGTYERDAVAGLKAQAKARAVEVVSEQPYEAGGLRAAEAAGALARKGTTHVVFFGAGQDFAALAGEAGRAGLRVPLLSSAVMIGRGAFELPPEVAARTHLSYPGALPERDDPADFFNTMRGAGVPLRSPAFQAIAYAGARAFVEALKSSGRRTSRTAIVATLEQLRDFRTGVVPPLTFDPNRRVGAAGSYVVGPDLRTRQYTLLSERIVPKE